MDLNPLNTLDWVDSTTGDLATLAQIQHAQSSGDYSALSPIDDDTGDILNTIPATGGPDMPLPSNTPPPPGYAWFYTPNNDRVPVALSTIPSQYFQYLSPDQINTGTNTAGPTPASAGPATSILAGGAMTWILIGGAVWYFFLRNKR